MVQHDGVCSWFLQEPQKQCNQGYTEELYKYVVNVVVHIPTKNMFVDKVKLTRTLAFLTNAEMLVEFGGRAMPMDVILQKRSNKGNDYLYFLLKFVPALVGYRTWVDSRLKTGLEEYFTNSDEAFLLLCYECYGEKWSHDYNAKTRRTTDGDDTQEEHSPVSEGSYG